MSIRFEQISYAYPGAAAGVAQIDLAVDRGELVALIGPSGSGKSTCLKLLAGFLRPSAGCLYLDGQDVSDLPPEQRRLGVVFQNYALFPHMSVLDNVAYPLKVRGRARRERAETARAMIERVGLGGLADRSPSTLSGGQQQRVALARALVFEPAALLLDEPLSALDAGLRVAMRDEIRSIQRQAGIPAIHVTHDQEEALSIADRVVVLREGRIEQAGTPRSIYDRPSNRFVAGFVGQANFFDGVVAAQSSVDTPIGRLSCTEAATMAQGSMVTVLIRPEAMGIQTSESGASQPLNRLVGTVGLDRFLGAVRRFDFHVAGGVLAVETSLRDAPLAVVIPPEAIRLLPRN